jgi:hypothetical protein
VRYFLRTMASKISYKVALMGAEPAVVTEKSDVPKPSAGHTFWEDCSFPERVPTEDSNMWEKEQYAALQHLKKSPTFQRKFAMFAENILCVTETDTEKGCRIDLRATQYWSKSTYSGKKKAIIGFWFLYRQDGFTYTVVYECDNLKDPRSGWFYQWEHDEDCCGFSCDYFGCPYNYPKRRN